MVTGKTRCYVVRVCILLFFCLFAVSKVFAEEVLVPKSTADYGSGYIVGGGAFYPGGVPELGLWLGRPNNTRTDRALARFTISRYLLRAIPFGSAKLCFGISAFSATEDTQEIEITYLPYNTSTLSVNDMLNSRAETVGSVTLKKNEGTGKEYSIDVTKYVNADIEKGNIYSAFRFRNVTVENNGKPDVSGILMISPRMVTQALSPS